MGLKKYPYKMAKFTHLLRVIKDAGFTPCIWLEIAICRGFRRIINSKT